MGGGSFAQGHCAQWGDLSGPKRKKAGNAKASDNRKGQNTTNPKGQEKVSGGGVSLRELHHTVSSCGSKSPTNPPEELSQSFLFCVWVQITPSSPQQQGAPSLHWLARMRGLDGCMAACWFISTKCLFFFYFDYLFFNFDFSSDPFFLGFFLPALRKRIESSFAHKASCFYFT